jgi:hypothetical protein
VCTGAEREAKLPLPQLLDLALALCNFSDLETRRHGLKNGGEDGDTGV